jgi:hypothetical protein
VNKSKDDKYKRLLGVDEEDLQTEALQLENSLGKKESSAEHKQAAKRV